MTLAVVTAYTRADEAGRAQQEAGGRKLLYSENEARAAMHKTIKKLTSDRIRHIEQDIVAAEALLRVAGKEPGQPDSRRQRGLGAHEGELLGSVPREIVRNAVCDVLIIQTSDDRREPT